MSQTDWRELAAWYDARLGDEGDLWHRTMLDLPLFAQMGTVAGLRVLDLACGNGHNTRRLARMGAHVTGVDWSAALIARNQAREQAALVVRAGAHRGRSGTDCAGGTGAHSGVSGGAARRRVDARDPHALPDRSAQA